MTFPSLRITRPSLVRPCCMPFALPGKIGGDVGMKVGSCVEAGRFLLGCTTKSSNVGEVGVHATTPVVTARFRCSRFDHDMNKNNVIKCNHFLARQPAFTLNTTVCAPASLPLAFVPGPSSFVTRP